MAVLLFVHGVATRAGNQYDLVVAARDRRFRQSAFAGTDLHIINSYWGGYGADPQWDLACVPSMSGDSIHLGVEDEEPPIGESDAVLRAARADFGSVVGALSVEELASLERDGKVEELQSAEAFWIAAASYARKSPAPQWLQEVDSDEAFAGELRRQVSPLVDADLGVLDPLAGIATRLGSTISNWINLPVARIARERITPAVAIFIGDVFRYLREGEARAEIRAVVVADLVTAAKAALAAGEPLVVMGHSMGGIILYDLLSDDSVVEDIDAKIGQPLAIDLFMTVGSQVSLFEELKLFGASDPTRSGKAASPLNRALRPTRVARWWNAYDRVDVLSFVAKPIFDKVEDFEVDTIAGVRSAHSAYFTNMVFYDRLHVRMRENGVIA